MKWMHFMIFFLVALVPFCVSSIDPFKEAIGHQNGDVYKRLWTFWRIIEEENSVGFPWTNLLNAPSGGFLLDVHTLPALVMMPITQLLGPSFSLNIWVWFNLMLIGWSVFALLKALEIKETAALPMAALCQIQPYLWGYPIASGVHERLTIWIVPLMLLCLLKRQESNGHWKWTGLGAFGLIWVGFSVPSYIVFTGIVILSFSLLTKLKKNRVDLLIWGALVVLIFGYVKYMSQSSWSLAPQGNRFEMLGGEPITSEAASLSSLFWPFTSRATLGDLSGDWLLRLSYIGILPILLALLSIRQGRSKPKTITVIGLFAVVLSLGPTIMGWINPLHFALQWTIPTFGAIPDHFQWSGIAFIALCVGIASLLSTLSTLKINCIITLILIEWTFAMPWNQVNSSASTTPSTTIHAIEDGPVFSVPRRWKDQNLALSSIFRDQINHRQPIFASVYFGVTAWDSYAPNALGISENWQKSLNCMRMGGGRWLYVQKDAYPDLETAQAVVKSISKQIKPTQETEIDVLFDLSALEIIPIEHQKLKPRTQPPTVNQAIEKETEGFDENPFAMVQTKCPVSGFSQHRP